ncbi:MAG: hypothetical protein ABFC63_09530 [Thermoguttaceae bacterium]
MKRATFSVLTIVVLIGLTGCAAQHGRRWARLHGQPAEACSATACDGQMCVDPSQAGDPNEAACSSCGGRGCRLCRDRCRAKAQCVDGGPASAAVTYPYYTTRGPRDFLAKNPPSIGP